MTTYGGSVRKVGIPGGMLLVVAILLAVGLLWKVNAEYSMRSPGGNDFLVHWMGAKSLLDGESPYSDATAVQIQEKAYGRMAIPGEHELRVAYPLYAEFLFVPFALVPDFGVARALWMTVLELAAMVFASLAFFLTDRTQSKWRFLFFLLFSMVWYLGIRAIINGNAIVLVGFLLALSIWWLKHNSDLLFGISLALVTIKPQVALILVLCILGWVLYTRRKRAILSFLLAMGSLVALSLLLLPDWIVQNWREVLRYPAYNPPSTPAAIGESIGGFVGQGVGWCISAGVIIFLLIQWWRMRSTGFAGLLRSMSWTIILSPLAGLQTDTGNELLLLIPLAWLLAGGSSNNPVRIFPFISVLVVIFIGLWAFFLATVQTGAQPQQSPLMLLLLPLFMGSWMLWNDWRNRLGER